VNKKKKFINNLITPGENLSQRVVRGGGFGYFYQKLLIGALA